MSITTFVEATSPDPFVRGLHRRAVRLLNDSSIDRRKREFHMRRLQSILIEHLAKQEAKAQRLAEKKAQREQVSCANRNQGVADPSQVVARRKEFAKALQEPHAQVTSAEEVAPSQQTLAANEKPVTGRIRPVLTLKGA